MTSLQSMILLTLRWQRNDLIILNKFIDKLAKNIVRFNQNLSPLILRAKRISLLINVTLFAW